MPPPPVADLVGFHPTFVTPGYVVFAYEPREEHYNTLGAVHGGILTTVLDTVMGCAVHSKLDAGLGPGHDRAEDELRPPGHARVRDCCAPRAASSIPARASRPPRRLLEGEDGTLFAHASSTWLITSIAGKAKKEPLARVAPAVTRLLQCCDGAALQARRRRGALAADLGGRGPLPRRRRRAPRRDVRDLRAAAERHRRAAHGPRAERLDPGRADPLAPDAGLRHALAAGVRPRRHLDAERRREAARARGHVAARSSAARRSSSASGATSRRPAARSWASSAGSAPRSTTPASASRWTTPTSRR